MRAMRAKDVAAAAVVVLVAGACGNNNVVVTDGAADAAGDALACGPATVSDAGVSAMHPPNAPHAGACPTSALIADYVACNVGSPPQTNKCPQFQSGQAGAPCAACIESQTGAANWGVIVFNGSTGTPNIGGCVDDALGQVGMEPSSCGQLIYASYSCQNAACNACSPNETTFDASDFDTCDAIAVATVCASYNAAVQSLTGPCTALLGDAGLPTPVSSCFPDPSIQDPIAQETSWLEGIINYMCGP